MTDLEWIAAVRKYAVEFGSYNFSPNECKRMVPYLVGTMCFPAVTHPAKFNLRLHASLTTVFDLMDEMERGMVDKVTASLT